MGALLGDERFAPYLQDAYYTQREDRYVLPVRTDGKGFVRGIVHGTSQSGQTLFIEPEEIVDLNNRAKLAEADVADEERRILVKFSGWVAEEADAFDAALAAAETLDVIASAAIIADDTVATEPIIDEAPRIGLLHARHPLMLLAERRCVANDVTVAAGDHAPDLGAQRRRQDRRAQDRRARRADGRAAASTSPPRAAARWAGSPTSAPTSATPRASSTICRRSPATWSTCASCSPPRATARWS